MQFAGLHFEPGLHIGTLIASGPADIAGLKSGDLLVSIDGTSLNSYDDLAKVMLVHKPNETVKIKTQDKEFSVILGVQDNKPLLGISFDKLVPKKSIAEKYGSWPVDILLWFFKLFDILINLNIGVGIFNLLPIGPIDGGRMFKVVLERFVPKNADSIHKTVSLILLFLFLFVFVFPLLRGFIKI